MREVLLLALVALVFLVILHTTKADFDRDENALLYNILFRKGKKVQPKSKSSDGVKKSQKSSNVKSNSNNKNTKTKTKNTKTKKSKTKSNKLKNKSNTKKVAKTAKTTKKKNTPSTKSTTKQNKKPTTKNPSQETKTKNVAKIPTNRHNFTAMFLRLNNYQVGATAVPETKYTWIASVAHSRTGDIPYMCTATCIQKRIFITAARCILTLKVLYTSVKYQGHRLPAIAFVTPSRPTRQHYEDIGIIVVDDKGFTKKWDTIEIELLNVKRKDEKFQWFSDLNLSVEAVKNTFKIVGYATEKFHHKIQMPDFPNYILSELNVKVSRKMCDKILYKHNVRGFDVPCYMACTLEQYMGTLIQNTSVPMKYPNCQKYHGVEGGALINVNTNKLLGVATWGVDRTSPPSSRIEFPVGFAVPNSKSFINDYKCAQKIRDSPKQPESYQKICSEK